MGKRVSGFERIGIHSDSMLVQEARLSGLEVRHGWKVGFPTEEL